MSRYAVLFPGQGSQHIGMLPWLESCPDCAPALEALARELGDWRSRLEDAAWRDANAVAQRLVVGVALAAWAALEPRLPGPPAAAAGYSAGEIAACSAVGAFGVRDALALCGARASAMDAAGRAVAGAMLAVSGLAPGAVERTCIDLEMEWAIDLGPMQSVQAGPAVALDAAQARLAALGARCRRLPVGVASHTRWMRAAAQRFARRLAAFDLATPRVALVSGASGRVVRDPAGIRLALCMQVDHRLEWATVEETLAQRGVRCVLEVGAGSALARGWNERVGRIPARALEDFRGPDAAAAWVAARLSES